MNAWRSRALARARCLIVSIVTLALAPNAYANTFTVTGPDDPVPNGCLPNDCSLREAIAAANNNANVDVIEVPAGTYGLTRGKLTVSGSVTIHGADGTTIEGDGSFPVFEILGPISTTLSNLTILGHGAHALDRDSQVEMTIEFVTIPEEDAEVGIADLFASTGTLDVRASQIHTYITCGGIAACRIEDSAIWRLQVGFDSSAQTNVEILRSSIDGDLASAPAAVVLRTSGTVTISDSTIHKSAGLRFQGGLPSSVLLDHVAYIDNSGPLLVTVPTSVTIVDSTFSGNVVDPALTAAAAIVAIGGSTWDISNSTFAGNIGNDMIGGAVLVKEAAHMAIRNSTFSGNSFSATSAANGARGAAIGYAADAGVTSLLLQHVTIVAPAFAPAGILGTALGGSGGESGVALTVLNSILRGTCSLDANAMDINIGNIESPGDTCDFDSGNNLVNVSSGALALGSLGDHGGATPTYEPGLLSVAVDNPDSAAFCTDTDQRGYQRPFGDGCDVGAVERGAQDRVFANGFE